MSVNASPKFWVVSNFARGGFVLTCNFVVIHVEWLGTVDSSYSLQRRVHVNQEAIAIREDFSYPRPAKDSKMYNWPPADPSFHHKRANE